MKDLKFSDLLRPISRESEPLEQREAAEQRRWDDYRNHPDHMWLLEKAGVQGASDLQAALDSSFVFHVDPDEPDNPYIVGDHVLHTFAFWGEPTPMVERARPMPGQEAAEDLMARRERSARLRELLDSAKVQVGLGAQGHLVAVRRLVRAGASWEEIGAAIGWDGETAAAHYQARLEALARRDDVGGHTPVQGFGYVNLPAQDLGWFFYADGESWTLDIGPPEISELGGFVDERAATWSAEGAWDRAGWMAIGQAKRLIFQALWRYRQGESSWEAPGDLQNHEDYEVRDG